MSDIAYKHLHQHPHLLINGINTLGIDFYAIKHYDELQKANAQSMGSGVEHYSFLRTRIVLDEPDYRWNRIKKRPRDTAGVFMDRYDAQTIRSASSEP